MKVVLDTGILITALLTVETPPDDVSTLFQAQLFAAIRSQVEYDSFGLRKRMTFDIDNSPVTLYFWLI